MMKIIITIIQHIGATVLFIIIVSVGVYLQTEGIVPLKYEIIKYTYYFGLGILSYYPCNAILNHYKK